MYVLSDFMADPTDSITVHEAATKGQFIIGVGQYSTPIKLWLNEAQCESLAAQLNAFVQNAQVEDERY